MLSPGALPRAWRGRRKARRAWQACTAACGEAAGHTVIRAAAAEAPGLHTTRVADAAMARPASA
jgi:hypothetical protein